MTLSILWDHVPERERKTTAYAKTALKVFKGVLFAAGVAAVMIAIVAIRVYIFVPGLR